MKSTGKMMFTSFEKEKDPLSPRQYTGAHLRSFDGQNYEIKITTFILVS